MTTLLIIDDEIPTLDMLKLFLEACGYTVLAAEDAANKCGALHGLSRGARHAVRGSGRIWGVGKRREVMRARGCIDCSQSDEQV